MVTYHQSGLLDILRRLLLNTVMLTCLCRAACATDFTQFNIVRVRVASVSAAPCAQPGATDCLRVGIVVIFLQGNGTEAGISTAYVTDGTFVSGINGDFGEYAPMVYRLVGDALTAAQGDPDPAVRRGVQKALPLVGSRRHYAVRPGTSLTIVEEKRIGQIAQDYFDRAAGSLLIAGATATSVDVSEEGLTADQKQALLAAVAADGGAVPSEQAGPPPALHLDMQPTPPNLTPWKRLISFRPPTPIQQDIRAHGDPAARWFVHRLENAYGDGPVNLDYYPVVIDRLPTVNGAALSASDFLRYVRLNLNDFVDTTWARFSPYPLPGQADKWAGADPTGAYVHIVLAGVAFGYGPDDGSVVVSESAPDHWVFSTLWTTLDKGHPVSGNREFGIAPQTGGGYVLYTRAADRATSQVDYLSRAGVFWGGERVWRSLQQKAAAFVNAHQGAAHVDTAATYSERQEWKPVRDNYWAPATPWLP